MNSGANYPTQANRRLEWATHPLFIPLGGRQAHDLSGRDDKTSGVAYRTPAAALGRDAMNYFAA
jgi:hypothetical protein